MNYVLIVSQFLHHFYVLQYFQYDTVLGNNLINKLNLSTNRDGIKIFGKQNNFQVIRSERN